MKQLLFFFTFLVFSFVGHTQESLLFENKKIDLGDLIEGEIKEMSFSFENISKDTVVILEVIPQCGCTVSDFKKESLLPQNKILLSFYFDTKDKIGLQRKTISVVLNNEERYVLVFTANVISK
jgi:hypothetical protein